MSLGLVGAAGTAALRNALREKLIGQAVQARQQQEMDLAERRMALAEQDSSLRAGEREQDREDKKIMFARLQHQDEMSARDRELTQARQLDESTPAGFIPNTPDTQQITGRLRMIGAVTPQPGRAPVDEGPLLPGDTGAARQDGFMKRATAAQANTQADNDRAAQQASAMADYRNEQLRLRGDQLQLRGEMAGAASQNRGLQNELQLLKIQAEKDKQEAAHKATADHEANAKQSTDTALELVSRLESHPGLSKGTGIIGSRLSGFSQEATDANGIREQLVAALTAPNLGALKGPMSDKDVIFVKNLSTRLGNHQLSEAETRKALQEAKTFLLSKGAGASTGKPSAEDLIKKYGGQ